MMNNWKKTKEIIKCISRRYLGYDPGLRKIKIDDDFLDQKNLLVKINVEVIFDVGANVGQTTQKYRKLFPRSKIYSFEPFSNVFNTYSINTEGDKMIHKNQIALSDNIGESSFFTHKCHYTNSLLPISDKYKSENNYKLESKIKVKTDTLDNFCEKNNINRINILKMDVQGGEMLVLEGSKEMLSKKAIDLIYTEVEFVAIYENQPLFDDIKKYLMDYGYILYKNYNLAYDTYGVPIAGDVVFIRPNL